MIRQSVADVRSTFGLAPDTVIIGVDETGRGSCFGPIITCAVAFPPAGIKQALMAKLGDSKALSERRRNEAAIELAQTVLYAFGAASAFEVDKLNPLKATMLAMRRAVLKLGLSEAHVMTDGPYYPDLPHKGQAVIRGDAQIPEIMAASILAKVFRDKLVGELAARYPEYGLERHAGYGTKAHFDAVRKIGASRLHRLSFLRKALAVNQPEKAKQAA